MDCLDQGQSYQASTSRANSAPGIRSARLCPCLRERYGPRDGLQNEAAIVSTADKIAFVDRLAAAGLPVIEVAAFVSPKWVPRMADAGEVFAGLTRHAGVRYTAHVYDGVNHGFHNDTTQRYDEAAAKLAWSRTVEFFKKTLLAG